MLDIVLRAALPEDAETLAALGWATFAATFVEGFAIPYAAEDLPGFREREYAPAVYARFLSDPASRVWIAERGGEAVAYAYAGAADLPHADRRAGDGELKRLYVRSDTQGLGLGRRLLEAALGWLDPDRARTVWIGVWSGNLKAQRLYEAYGFTKVGEYGFPVGRVVDREFILRRLPASPFTGELSAAKQTTERLQLDAWLSGAHYPRFARSSSPAPLRYAGDDEA